jgi:hypothetical protein
VNETQNDMSDWRGRVDAIDGDVGCTEVGLAAAQADYAQLAARLSTNSPRSVGNVGLDEAPADLRVQPLDLDFEIVQVGDGFFDR